MKKYKNEEVKLVRAVPEVAYCNKCGKEHKDEYQMNHWTDKNNNELHNFSFSFGYYSSFDMERWSFDLCEDCIIETVKGFKFVPDGFKKDTDYPTVYEDQVHQDLFDEWKETGEWNEYKYYTYEQLIEIRDGFNIDTFEELVKKYHPDRYDDYVENYQYT